MTSSTKIFQKVSHAFEGNQESRKKLYRDLVLHFNQTDTVMDLGCGDGTWLEILRENNIRSFGVDTDKEKLDICRRKKLFVSPDVDLVPTAITMFHIVEHLQPLEAINIINNPKANKILIITPNIEYQPVLSSFWKDITHVRPYPNCVLVEMCKQCGFNHTQSFNQNGLWDTCVYAER